MAGSKNGDEKYLVIFQPSGCRGYIQKGKTLKEASVALGVDLEGCLWREGHLRYMQGEDRGGELREIRY